MAEESGEEEVPYVCYSVQDLNTTQFPSNYIRTTKYTFYNFIFLNLWEQFHKVSNVYFLINMIIALLGVSPIFPVTSILPLVFVLAVAAIKDAIEDYSRYTEDRKANGTPTCAVKEGRDEKGVRADSLKVGDFVKVYRDEGLPADLLVIYAPGEGGKCFVETANLDGETNIKPRQCPACTLHFKDAAALQRANLKVVCDQPNEKLDKWKGRMETTGEDGAPIQRPLVLDNMVFRGCVLKNTPYMYGMVIYAGVDTKMFRNLKKKQAKHSRLDVGLNRLIIGLLVIQQVVIAVLAALSILWRSTANKSPWLKYAVKDTNGFVQWGLNYLTFFVLLSFMMPISLFVSMELCKAFQAKFMDMDLKMANGSKMMKAKTSNLNDELAMITYIFSDKTGTLTQNEMRFHSCAILAFTTNEIEEPGGVRRHLEVDGRYQEAIYAFMEVLSLCHTCVVSTAEDGVITYEGPSTDEVALVTMAKNNGFMFTSMTASLIEVQWLETTRNYEMLALLPFSSNRKRMSVLVRDADGEIWLLMKGADSKVMPLTRRQSPEDEKWYNHTMQELDKMAKQGLRTLAVAHKQITTEEYESWKGTWEAANLALQGQEQLIANACDIVERDLVLLGCTGVEDRLQDQVPETIHFLLEAGLVIWVLTGDKRETAVNIAQSSKLVDSENDVIHHLEASTPDDLQSQLHDVENKIREEKARGKKVTVVIDGETLEIALEKFQHQFRELAAKVTSAVCCRVTPLQKSQVVTLFQKLGEIALAVGDGANDVSMIQSARVGVGIMGVEGSQAELAADYAIPRFRMLKRLIVTHGRFCKVRNSMLIQYSFYKNLVLSLIQVYFAFYNGFTGQTLFDSWVMQCYNIFFTSLPPLILGIFEKDLPDDVVERNPKLFIPLPRGENFNLHTFLIWGISAIVHSLLIFFLMSFTFPMDDVARYRTSGLWTQGSVILTVIISVVLGKITLHTRHWTIINLSGIILSYVSYYVFVLAYNAFHIFFGNANYYNVANVMMADFKFYTWVLLFVLGVLGLDFILILIQRERNPSYRYAISEINKKKDLSMAQKVVEEQRTRDLYYPIVRDTGVMPDVGDNYKEREYFKQWIRSVPNPTSTFHGASLGTTDVAAHAVVHQGDVHSTPLTHQAGTVYPQRAYTGQTQYSPVYYKKYESSRTGPYQMTPMVNADLVRRSLLNIPPPPSGYHSVSTSQILDRIHQRDREDEAQSYGRSWKQPHSPRKDHYEDTYQYPTRNSQQHYRKPSYYEPHPYTQSPSSPYYSTSPPYDQGTPPKYGQYETPPRQQQPPYYHTPPQQQYQQQQTPTAQYSSFSPFTTLTQPLIPPEQHAQPDYYQLQSPTLQSPLPSSPIASPSSATKSPHRRAHPQPPPDHPIVYQHTHSPPQLPPDATQQYQHQQPFRLLQTNMPSKIV